MAHIRELFGTGYSFENGELDVEGESEDPVLNLRKLSVLEYPDLARNGAEIIVDDLGEYLSDRLYHARVGYDYSYTRHWNGSEIWEIRGELIGSETEAVCALVVGTTKRRNLQISLPASSDELYPEVGISPRVQRFALLNDYSQLFRYTERTIQSGRRPARGNI